jgi:glycosyltransferase involved in cell wall biosynthesis
MAEPWGVSVIIVNYNNERFLKAAIDSALAQDHPICEVVVVDDCSTDNSREVIASYGSRIRSVLREINGHQIAALNSAWPVARYPILIFLDSDDLLLPHAASRIACSWVSGTVKAQFPLVSIDSLGRPLGHITPNYVANLTTAMIREELLCTGQSPSSPGSGNAYSRSLLERVVDDGGFDLDEPRDYWMDNILECNAPFYGEIITIREPLACYRFHQTNLYLMNRLDCAHFAYALKSSTAKLEYLARRCRKWGIPFDPSAGRNRSPWLLDCRLVTAKLAPANDPSRIPIREILYYGFKAHMRDKGPKSVCVARTLWFVGVALSPRPVSIWLIGLRFMVAQRPRWFGRLFARLRNVSDASGHARRKMSQSRPGNGLDAIHGDSRIRDG